MGGNWTWEAGAGQADAAEHVIGSWMRSAYPGCGYSSGVQTKVTHHPKSSDYFDLTMRSELINICFLNRVHCDFTESSGRGAETATRHIPPDAI
jgi:hypothetical protein